MLLSLHVKNLALIEETEVEFGPGLTILTGETGAGKSILIGSINIALGARFEKELLRSGTDTALVELLFQCNDVQVIQYLQEFDIPVEEDSILISRRLQSGKSISRINGETVTVKQVKEIAEKLLDLHGQHEHQSLLHQSKHREILDAFGGRESEQLLELVSSYYKEVSEIRKKLEESRLDETTKKREQALLTYECEEIEEANLQEGEDEALEAQYQKLNNGKKIVAALGESYQYTSEGTENASTLITKGLRCLNSVKDYDQTLQSLEEQLLNMESLLADYNREIAIYLEDLEYDQESFLLLEERLNIINHSKEKYGNSISNILQAYAQKQERLQLLADYDTYIQSLEQQLLEKEAILQEYCTQLTNVRIQNASLLEKKLITSLKHLNFLTIEFVIHITPKEVISIHGQDQIEFLISTNPGEAVKSLSQVASGGELSRIMLGIKTVLANQDQIDTLIFDEIDAGISGKTAWRVAEQLDTVAKEHQVICITHLPQIAAMADTHFLIQKEEKNLNTITSLYPLQEKESLEELARLLARDDITDPVL